MLFQRYKYFHTKYIIKWLSTISMPFKVIRNNLDTENYEYKESLSKSSKVKLFLDTFLEKSKAGGGAKAVQKHTVIKKKLLPRHRLNLLFDKNSALLEIAPLAGTAMEYGSIPSAGGIIEIGQVHGHYCIVLVNDATVKGGTSFPISVTKQIRAQQLSFLNRLPCIYLIDSGGAFLPLQSEIFPDKNHGGRIFHNEAVLSAKGISQISVICGSCTAGAAYCPTMSEDVIIVKNIGTLYLAGPPLVKAATGEVVTEQELGGAEVHCRISGCTDHYAESEEEAFEMCRESVVALNLPEPQEKRKFSEPLYPVSDLMGIASKKFITFTDMYQVLARILDGSMFKEFKAEFGSNLITGFGFIHGQIVGILANCGPLTSPDALKGCHFILLCEKRCIPLLFLQNSGKAGKVNNKSEGEVIKDRAKMVAAHSCAHVPKITLNIGGCCGDDNYTMCGWNFEPNFFFSWPLAHTSSSVEYNSEDIFSDTNYEINNTNLAGKMEKIFLNTSSAFYRSSHILQDGIILPEDTRKKLAFCLDVAMTGLNFRNIENHSFAILRM